jgi:hypothetical protein
MNLSISSHSIFQDEESLGREEEVEAVVLDDLDAVGLEDTTDGGGQDSKEEGHEEGAGLYDEEVGVTVLL